MPHEDHFSRANWSEQLAYSSDAVPYIGYTPTTPKKPFSEKLNPENPAINFNHNATLYLILIRNKQNLFKSDKKS